MVDGNESPKYLVQADFPCEVMQIANPGYLLNGMPRIEALKEGMTRALVRCTGAHKHRKIGDVFVVDALVERV